MVYTESIRGYPYMRKEQLTKEFQISAGTVRTRLFEIEDEIKTGRYNDYAIIRDGNIVLINVLVFIDYLTYRRQLLDRNARTCRTLISGTFEESLCLWISLHQS